MTAPNKARIFIAGSTGATGRTLLTIAQNTEADLVPHLRPLTALGKPMHPQAAVLDLKDDPALEKAMTGCTTVVQLIGTMRKRFSTGDTYETSDIGTTKLLVKAAKNVGVEHIVLLSSVGAGKPMGAYLRAKAKAESIVRESGLQWTIFRPSAFEGEGHRPPPGMKSLTKLLGLHRYQPIALEQLAMAILHVAENGTMKGEVLEGTSLWKVIKSLEAQPGTS